MNFSAALGAGELGQLADQLADVRHDQGLDHPLQPQVRRGLGRAEAGLAGTAGAEVDLAALAVDRLGQVDGRLFRHSAGRSWAGHPSRRGRSRRLAAELVFERLDLVADPRRHLVILGGDGAASGRCGAGSASSAASGRAGRGGGPCRCAGSRRGCSPGAASARRGRPRSRAGSRAGRWLRNSPKVIWQTGQVCWSSAAGSPEASPPIRALASSLIAGLSGDSAAGARCWRACSSQKWILVRLALLDVRDMKSGDFRALVTLHHHPPPPDGGRTTPSPGTLIPANLPRRVGVRGMCSWPGFIVVMSRGAVKQPAGPPRAGAVTAGRVAIP